MENRAPGPARSVSLRGRASESALLDELVAAIRSGEGRALVIRGEAGIGKTALLEYLIDSASDMNVVRTVGMESEMELAYASLHLLCGSLLDRLSTIPAPQRRALEIVFGLSDGAPPDRFLVGLAVLSLLSGTADVRPLLCVLDDAQWLDQASAVTLAFVARRLMADPVGIVFAAREPGENLQHLPELEVHGLVNGDAQALLSSAVRLKLDQRVRDRIIAEAHGNPLALLELPRGLTATPSASEFVAAQGVSGRIEETFMRRVEALSDDARRRLVIAASEPLGDPLLLMCAAEQLGITVSGIDAETDGLLTIGARVAFRHPLVRSVVYRTAPAQERRAAHLALAEVTDPMVDPDRRAWHLASAAPGPDEQVAVELERSAGRAQARGGLAATAAFLERALELTSDPALRANRALAAARASFQAGASDTALRLLSVAEAGALHEFQRAQVDLLRGHVALTSPQIRDAPALLLKAATRLEPFDIGLARETYVTAWGAAFTGPHASGAAVLAEISRAIQALPPPVGDPDALDLLLNGLALLTLEGQAAAAAPLKHAAELLTGISAEEVLRWGWVGVGAPTAVWDDEGFLAIATRQVQIVREAGAVAQLPVHLLQLGLARVQIGDFDGAASLIEESAGVAAAVGSELTPSLSMRLLALQGREDEASAAIAREIRSDHPRAYWAAAILYNGLGLYRDAASAARQAASSTVPPPSMWALPELVEAAVRSGDGDLARDALDRLAATTQPSGTDYALGIETRCRALLSEGSVADALYREAIDRLGRTRLRPELARAHLLYGEWLRRENRRLDAREQLRAAHSHFTSIGMEGFAERARMELLATGEKVRKRTVETRDELTEQERQIGRLARDGLSNSEIGARMFLSPRTIEWHLRKVFTKLGIHSRRELMSGLRDPEPELLPT